MRKPPLGMMARLSGASVCKPDDDFVFAIDVTGGVRSDGTGICEISSTPFLRSSTNNSFSRSQIRCVRSVAGARNDSSPSYGL